MLDRLIRMRCRAGIRREGMRKGRRGGLVLWGGVLLGSGLLAPAHAVRPLSCNRPLYLTIETGHMGVATEVASILQRQGVVATFFLANERTRNGGYSLDAEWSSWWQRRAVEGHAFGSQTWDRWAWRRDGDGVREVNTVVVRPSVGVDEGRRIEVDAQAYCQALQRPAERLQGMTGQAMLPLFRAPEGKTSPRLLAMAASCGWLHVPWSADGDLGDEWPLAWASDSQLLRRALRNVGEGDVLRMRLGGGERETAWAPAVLEPLLRGLKSRGYCFATLADHPAYADWLSAHPPKP